MSLELVAFAEEHLCGVMHRALVEEAFARSGARRLDTLAEKGSEGFYRTFEHQSFAGYRLYPE